MANNFKCPECGKEHFISQFSFRGDGKHYDKYSKVLKCDCENKCELIFIEKEFTGIPTIGSNKSQQIDLLKKRSKEHFNKEIKEKKEVMNKQQNYHV
ncbi:MAG TPA: hypothetical protein PKI46_04355 [Bacteroidales bacterium]|nr:hypothetical protein [Bacteroidales bacterium]